MSSIANYVPLSSLFGLQMNGAFLKIWQHLKCDFVQAIKAVRMYLVVAVVFIHISKILRILIQSVSTLKGAVEPGDHKAREAS